MNCTILEPFDPENIVPGGIDTALRDLISAGELFQYNIIGVSSNRQFNQSWKDICILGTKTPFFPIMHLDKFRHRMIPHSLRFSIGILRFYKLIRHSNLLQIHRVEIAVLASIVFPTIPVILFIHNDGKNFSINKSESLWKFLPWLYIFLERIAIKKSFISFIFSKSGFVRLSHLTDKLHYSSTWFNSSVFSWKEIENHPSEFTILFVGRFEEQKDLDLWFEVAKSLANSKLQSFRFELVGGGSKFEHIQEKFKNSDFSTQVRFHSILSREKVAEMMNLASVLLLTSKYEGSPRVLYEAGGCGLPVVCTFESDFDGWLDGTNGFRVKRRDPELLAAAVHASLTLSRQDIALRAGKKSAKFVIKEIEDAIVINDKKF